MNKKILLAIFLALLIPTALFSATLVSENWDSGTPASGWPCKDYPSCNGDSFNGWYPGAYDCDVCDRSAAGISTTRYHTSPNSFYQLRPSGYAQACDLWHDLATSPTTIHLRFYAYFESGWANSDSNTYIHWVFTNSALSNTGFRINWISANQYNCEIGANELTLMPQSNSTAWSFSGSSNWNTVQCDVNLQDYLNGWHCWEYRFEINTGESRIYVTEWIDGVQTRTGYGPNDGIASFTKVDFSGWENTQDAWDGGWYIDDVVIAEEYIGLTGSSTPTITGLSVQ